MLTTTNWALGRPAYQSSQNNGYSAALAVDGNNDTVPGAHVLLWDEW